MNSRLNVGIVESARRERVFMIPRTEPTSDDIERIIEMHRTIYAAEYGFDESFGTYVAGPLREFFRTRGEGERIWLADRDGRIAGCIAIVRASEREARLRWFLVVPSARGSGLGRQLLENAVSFSRDRGYEVITLWTVSALSAAARLYRAAGFARLAEKPGRQWGVEVVEEMYRLRLN